MIVVRVFLGFLVLHYELVLQTNCIVFFCEVFTIMH